MMISFFELCILCTQQLQFTIFIDIVFITGKRVCVGEVLAKHTLFTYFTSVLQRYSFHVPPEREAPKLRPVVKGFTISPDPYTALVKPRHQL
jgi:cytochrome P450